jgi:hypothetical protein
MKLWCLGTRAIAAVFVAWLTMVAAAVAQEAEAERSAASPQTTPNTVIDQSGSEPNQVEPTPEGSGTILTTNRPVEVRAGPSASASVLYGFPAGRPFRLMGREAGFAHIQDLHSTATGWIDETAVGQPSSVETTSAPSAPQATQYNEDAATASTRQGEDQPPSTQTRRSGQGPLSGFLGGLFGNR